MKKRYDGLAAPPCSD